MSGLDPKFIEEAAYELHEIPKARGTGRAKVLRFRKGFSVALPMVAAAAVLIIIIAVIPNMARHGNTAASSEAPASYSDAAASEAAEPAAEAAESYEEEAAMEAPAEAAEHAKTAGTAADQAIAEDALSISEAEEASNEAFTYGREKEKMPELTEALYEDGILTVTVKGSLPDDPENLDYSLTKTGSDGTVVTLGEGTLRDIMTERDPLTLDLTELELPDGTYTLTIAGRTVEFTK